MIKLQFKIGKSVMTYEDVQLKNIFKFSALMGALPEVCDNCKSPEIFLSFKSPKGNDYYTLTCKKCGAELTFHQKKEGGMYLKFGEIMKPYQPNGETKNNVPEAKKETEKEFSENYSGDSVPF